MEKGLKAFFYEYKYYLLPDSCESVDDLKKEKAWEVKRLKEELCMAPDFVYESMETELLTIEYPERVFPAEINLYTCEEYDKLLREQVKRVCATCANYVDEGDGSLDGHHREISLDGVCYLKEREDERWSFAFCAEVAWERIADKGEELLKYIEKSKQDKIFKLVSEELGRFFLPNAVYGGYDEEGPCLAFYANDYAGHPGIRLILKMLAETANKEGCGLQEYGIKVYPYLPKGMLPAVKKPDYVKKPSRLFVKEDEETGELFVGLFEPKLAKADEERAVRMSEAAYQYVCYCVGENALLGGCSGYSMLEELPADMREVAATELEELLLKRAQPEESMPEPFFPSPYFREAYEEEPEMLPYKEALELAMTLCPEFSPERLNENMEGGNTVYEDFNIVYAYLYMPKGDNDFDAETRMGTLVWYLQNLEQYPEPIGDGELPVFMKKAGTTITERGYCEDLMIFDEKAFFRWMRHLTPVFKGLGVKLVTVKREGTIVYEPDYRIVAEGSDWLN